MITTSDAGILASATVTLYKTPYDPFDAPYSPSISPTLTFNGQTYQVIGQAESESGNYLVSIGANISTATDQREFITQNGQTVATTFPGTPQAVNDLGVVVGFTVVGNTEMAFIYDHGNTTTFGVPGAWGTLAEGINDAGEVVGTYYTENGGQLTSHGFIDWMGKVTTFDIAGATQTAITGINDSGQIAGIETIGTQQFDEYHNLVPHSVVSETFVATPLHL